MGRPKIVEDGVVITVYLSSYLAEEAKRTAKAQDRSRSALIRELVREYLDSLEPTIAKWTGEVWKEVESGSYQDKPLP